MAIKHQKPDPLGIIGESIILSKWNKVIGEIKGYDLQTESYEIRYPDNRLRYHYPKDIPAPDGVYCTHHYVIIRTGKELLTDACDIHIGTREEMIEIRDNSNENISAE